MCWKFPLIDWNGFIPTGNHPGSFASVRKHDIHTGVDLYVTKNPLVKAVEPGIVVNIENFTGPEAESPWWLPTKAILIEGKSGVICYGEVMPIGTEIGEMILQDQVIGYVSPVLPKNKERTDIPGHSRYMLHFELYNHGTRETVWWRLKEKKPGNLLDPTMKLREALNEYR